MGDKIIYTPSETTHWKNLFESKSMMLGSHNLNPGEELIVEIDKIDSSAVIKDSNGNEEGVVALHFTNAPAMCLNITNSRVIASLYGEYHDGWIGKSIQLYATQVNSFGSMVSALRVREAIPDTEQDLTELKETLESCKSIKELQEAFIAIPKHLKPKLTKTKDIMKGKLTK